jgi:hypothetical protein
MGLFRRFIKYLEDLIARYNAAVDHTDAWRRSKFEPLPKWKGEITSELKRRSPDT